MHFDCGIGNAMRACRKWIERCSLGVVLAMSGCAGTIGDTPADGEEERAEDIVPAAAEETPQASPPSQPSQPPQTSAGETGPAIEYSPYFYVWSWQSGQYSMRSL